MKFKLQFEQIDHLNPHNKKWKYFKRHQKLTSILALVWDSHHSHAIHLMLFFSKSLEDQQIQDVFLLSFASSFKVQVFSCWKQRSSKNTISAYVKEITIHMQVLSTKRSRDCKVMLLHAIISDMPQSHNTVSRHWSKIKSKWQSFAHLKTNIYDLTSSKPHS